MRIRRDRWRRAIAVAGLVWLFASASCTSVREITVTVTNSTQDLMRDVSVAVTGAQYRLGDIVSESSKSVVVKPTGESSVTVRYVGPYDFEETIDANVYMEPSYRGTIGVTVYPGADSKVFVNVKP